MTTKYEEYFLAVAKYGSLSAAAEVLYMSQPSLTKYMQTLEAQLGVQLFNRETKPLRLNEAGQIYAEYLRQTIETEKSLKKELDQASKGKRGILRIGAPSFLGQFLFPKIIPPFYRLFSNVNLIFQENAGQILQTQIATGELDIAFAYTPVTDSNVNYVTITHDQILMVMAKPENYTNGKDVFNRAIVREIEPDGIPKLSYCLYNENQLISAIIDDFFQSQRLAPDVVLRSSNPLLNMYFVAEVPGCATFAPSYVLGQLPQELTQKLIFFRISTSSLLWDLRALYRKRTSLNIFTKEMVRIAQSIDWNAYLR